MEFNFNESIEANPHVGPPINTFDVQVLLSSIHRTDDLVRHFNQKCDENRQIQQETRELKDLSDQIRQLYANEKAKNEQLLAEKQKACDENQRLKAELLALQHEQVNNETLQKQTLAEWEYRFSTAKTDSDAKYVGLCETLVAQGLILHTNGLATPLLSKKCAQAREVLKSHHRPFEWSESRSAPKTARSPTKAAKCKCGSKTSPTKEASHSSPVKRVLTSEKGTMSTQTTATRSTCTSAFIRTVDASTNTVSDDTDTELSSIVQRILDETLPLPPFHSPIHEVEPSKRVASIASCTNGSTQTEVKMYRSRGTVTHIQNVRKKLNYARSDNDRNATMLSDPLQSIKKEDMTSPFGSMSNLVVAPESALGSYRSQQFLHLWILLGQMLFPIADQVANYPRSASPDPKLMEKFQQIQSILGAQSLSSPFASLLGDNGEPCIDLMNDSGDEHMATGTLIKESVSDCSQDSVRSNESDRIGGSEAHTFRSVSPFADDNSVDTRLAVTELSETAHPSILQESVHENEAQTGVGQNDKNDQFKVPKRKALRTISEGTKSKRKRKAEKVTFFYLFYFLRVFH